MLLSIFNTVSHALIRNRPAPAKSSSGETLQFSRNIFQTDENLQNIVILFLYLGIDWTYVTVAMRLL